MILLLENNGSLGYEEIKFFYQFEKKINIWS